MSGRGPAVCNFIEGFLFHSTGDSYGQPFRLRDWQHRIIHDLYETRPDGRRRYTRALLGLPKGNGKTELAAAIGLYELFASESPIVCVVASSYEQADLVFGAARSMVAQSPDLSPLVEPLDREIRLRDGPGRLHRVAAVTGANDGLRPTVVIIDELHELVDAKERVHLVLTNGLAKRADGLELSITTAGVAGTESLCERLYELGRSGKDPRFYFRWFESGGGANLGDPAQLAVAIREANPAADDFVSVENLIRRHDEIPEAEFRRYFLNQWTEAPEIWEVAEWWPGLRSPLNLDPTLPVCVGIDVGVRHDSSAVVVAQAQTERVVLRAQVWENPYPRTDSRHDSWTLKIAEIENWLRGLADAFPASAREEAGRPVKGPAFFYDPHFFERSAQDLAGEGLNMVEYPQQDARMIPASQSLFELAKTGVLAHDGNRDLERHVRAVTAEPKPRGWRISRPKGSRKPIDAAVAAAIAAHEAARTIPSSAVTLDGPVAV